MNYIFSNSLRIFIFFILNIWVAQITKYLGKTKKENWEQKGTKNDPIFKIILEKVRCMSYLVTLATGINLKFKNTKIDFEIIKN